MYMYTCMYIYMYVHVYVCTCTCIHGQFHCDGRTNFTVINVVSLASILYLLIYMY